MNGAQLHADQPDEPAEQDRFEIALGGPMCHCPKCHADLREGQIPAGSFHRGCEFARLHKGQHCTIHGAAALLVEPVDSMHAESLAAVREVRGDVARLRTIAASWTPRPYPGRVTR